MSLLDFNKISMVIQLVMRENCCQEANIAYKYNNNNCFLHKKEECKIIKINKVLRKV